MTFKNNFIKPKTKTEFRLGKIIYYENTFKLELYNGKILDVDAYDFPNAKFMYSKPLNDKYPKWTKKPIKNINYNKLDVVKKYWSTVYSTMKVKGVIINNKFIIKKYNNK